MELGEDLTEDRHYTSPGEQEQQVTVVQGTELGEDLTEVRLVRGPD